MRKIPGQKVQDGFVIAPIWRWPEAVSDSAESAVFELETEKNKFKDSLARTQAELTEMISQTAKRLGKNEAQIFEAHLQMAKDPEFASMVRKRIELKKFARVAIGEASESFALSMEKLNNAYLRERAKDIREVARQLQLNLTESGAKNQPPKSSYIIVAEDLPASFLAKANTDFLKGILLEKGGTTSHIAILARALGLPSLFHVDGLLAQATDAEVVVLDGQECCVLFEPGQKTLLAYQEKIKTHLEQKQKLEPWKKLDTKLKDELRVQLMANVGSAVEVRAAVEQGCEGVGLFRTEFLFMHSQQWPTEKEQIQTYKQTLESLHGRPAVFRTLDIGGDKSLPYFPLPKEDNPFLGVRGVRLYEDTRNDFFRTQLRGLIQAAQVSSGPADRVGSGPADQVGSVSIMIPMISCVEEIHRMKKIYLEELAKLEGSLKLSSPPRFGVMLEVPSMLFLLKEVSQLVDFVSVGTNDLVQYLIAADRTNPNVKNICSEYFPAVWRALSHIALAFQDSNCELSLCGEIGAKKEFVAALIGLGFRKISLSANKIPAHREWLSHRSLEECRALAKEVLAANSEIEIKGIFDRILRKS